jgi:CheY-like chemotaxis protein
MRRSASAQTRILVVDDEHLIADTTVAILRQDGFDATAAYSGTEAVQQAARLCPDIMVVDFFMPQMNGIEAAKLVREMCPNVKVFLLSGQASALDFLAHHEEHDLVYELLSKPIHPELLLATLRG